MSVLLQIERELVACNQARFEKVSGLLLGARGIRGISLLGSVEGKDKTRTGVPDIYASNDGRTFIFLACTTITGASAVKTKLLGDIDECTNTEKTGVELKRIDKLFLAFNSNLPPSALQDVADYGLSKNIAIEFLSLSEIALDLQRQYGWIAADELSVALDTGQFLPIDAFVNAYDHGKLATSLDTQFRFRETLVTEGLQALAAPGSVLVIAGPAGTGKTRLALEIARQVLERESTCQVHCVYNKDLPLFDDLNRYFSPPANYFILVDDANRVNGRTHILDLTKQSNDIRTYRFILTVRDYAENEVVRNVQLLGASYQRLSVGPLTRQELNEYLEKEFGITNDLFKSQIWALSHGNARLATMAAKEAVKTNNLATIHDVTDLYELYFSDIADVLKEPENALLKALGILSVLRHIRQRDAETSIRIQEAFGLTKEAFWIAIDRLHDLEFVDLHGHEVAKVSDQVLATFCFYLCFVKHKTLSFEALIRHFEKSALERIQEAVYGACNTMNVDTVRKVIDAPVIAAIEQSPPEQQLRLLKPFWFVDTSLTLRIAHDLILALPDNPVTDDMKWEEKNISFNEDPILSVLAQLRYSVEVDLASAIDLVFLYLTKRPEQSGKILKLLTEAGGFGFDRHSYRNKYAVQRLVADHVVAAAQSPHHSALLIEVANKFLAIEFDSSFCEDRSTVTFCHFGLEDCAEITHIRKTLWGSLKIYFRSGKYTERICFLLLNYARQHCRQPATDILRSDAIELEEWADLLDPSSYLHCIIIHALHRRLHWSGINVFEAVVHRFDCPAFKLRKLVSLDIHERQDSAFDYDAYERLKADRMFARYGSMSENDLLGFIALCQEIRNAKDGNNDDHVLRISVMRLFETIGEKNPQQLSELTRAYLRLGDPLEYGGWSWMPTLLRGIGKARTRAIIEIHQFPGQQAWLLSMYAALGEADIEKEDVEDILGLLENPTMGLPALGVLRRYEKFEPKILPKIVRLVLATRGEQAGSILDSLFSYPGTELEWLRSQFDNDIEILKTAYFTAQGNDRRSSGHFDYDARLFSLILDLAPDFISDYVQYRYANQKWLSEYDENHRDFECLWARNDWPKLLIDLIDAICGNSNDHGIGNYLAAWFPHSGGYMRSTLTGPGEEAVFHLVRNRARDQIAMQTVFRTLCSVDAKQRLAAFREFLSLNKSLEAFKKLPLSSSQMSSTDGSFLTQYRNKIHFIEELKGLLPGMEFIGHRAYLNEEIRSVQASITSEEEREFVGSYL
jgi:DNA polymerase III delta prime subunit